MRVAPQSTLTSRRAFLYPDQKDDAERDESEGGADQHGTLVHAPPVALARFRLVQLFGHLKFLHSAATTPPQPRQFRGDRVPRRRFAGVLEHFCGP